jgi:Na+/melibiose symporter-like transporter
VSTTSGQTAAQPDSALTAIAIGFGVVPAVLMLVSLPVLRRYRLTEDQLRTLAGGTSGPPSA